MTALWIMVAPGSAGAVLEKEEVLAKPRLTVSKATTYFTGPLRPDGSVDYVAALNELYGSGVTPETNAALSLMAILGEPVPEASARLMVGEQVPKPTVRFLGGFGRWAEYIEWRRQHGGPPPSLPNGEKEAGERLHKELAAAIAGPWSARDHPLVATWLEDMKPALEAIGEAAKRPRHWVPVTSLWETSPFDLVKRRNAADALRARAMLRLSDAGADGAATDLLTILRLAFLQVQGPSYVDHLIASTIAGIAFEALPRVAAHADLPPSAVVRMLSEIEALGAFPPPTEQIGRAERVPVLDGVGQLAFRGEWDDLKRDGHSFQLEPALRTQVDWDEALKMINRCYDVLIACQDAPTAVRRFACSEQDRLLRSFDDKAGVIEQATTDAMIGSTTAFVMPLIKHYLSLLLPTLAQSGRVFNEWTALERMGRMALVLRAYRLETGRFPERLDSLSVSERHGVSVDARDRGYRFSFASGAGAYAYTATPEEPGVSGTRSFCIDATGQLVRGMDGAEPRVENGRCLGGP